MSDKICSYVEHVAIRVKDIHWHIHFFKDVCGMNVREVDGDLNNPNQYWTIGGLQLMATPDLDEVPSNDKGWLAHLGIMVNNMDAVLKKAYAYDVKELPQGYNWLQLPDGLAVEFIQAAEGSIEEILSINPRNV